MLLRPIRNEFKKAASWNTISSGLVDWRRLERHVILAVRKPPRVVTPTTFAQTTNNIRHNAEHFCQIPRPVILIV